MLASYVALIFSIAFAFLDMGLINKQQSSPNIRLVTVRAPLYIQIPYRHILII